MFFFGDISCQVFPDRDKSAWQRLDSVMLQEPFSDIAKQHGFEHIMFGNQVHGTQGLIIRQESEAQRPFTVDADWIITNVPGLAVGVVTADCVPLLLYDPVVQVVGAVHAGWRGATDGVVLAALHSMVSVFGTKPENVQVKIGPHARTCCYSVNQLFYDTVMTKAFGKEAFRMSNNGMRYFDLYACCAEQLHAFGISAQQIQDTGICTVCTPLYASYRRDKERAGRNISCVGLVDFNR